MASDNLKNEEAPFCDVVFRCERFKLKSRFSPEADDTYSRRSRDGYAFLYDVEIFEGEECRYTIGLLAGKAVVTSDII